MDKINISYSEMQKVADPADISVLFFSAGTNFWAIWVIFRPIWAILGHFWAILCNFRSFLGHFLVLIFVAKYASVLFKSLFVTLVYFQDVGLDRI